MVATRDHSGLERSVTCDPHLALDVGMFVLAVANVAVLSDRFTILVPLDRIGDRDDARYRERFADLDLGVTVIDHLVQIVNVTLATFGFVFFLFCKRAGLRSCLISV